MYKKENYNDLKNFNNEADLCHRVIDDFLVYLGYNHRHAYSVRLSCPLRFLCLYSVTSLTFKPSPL